MWVVSSAGLARADGTRIDEATPEQLRAAQKTFEAADELFDAGRFEDAIAAYRVSFEMVASPNSRLMTARALERLGRLNEAYRELERALGLAETVAASDARYRSTLEAARKDLAAMQGRVGILRVTIVGPPVQTTVTVSDREIASSDLDRIVVMPGTSEIVVRSDCCGEVRRSVIVYAGQTVSCEIELSAAPAPMPSAAPRRRAPREPIASPHAAPSAPPLRPAAWAAVGIGAAGLAGFAAFGALHRARFDELKTVCVNDVCPSDRQDDIDSGRTFQTLANAGLVVGALGAAAGATLFVLSLEAPPARGSSRPSRPPLVALEASPGGLAWRTRFR